jgi:hypothetical protein
MPEWYLATIVLGLVASLGLVWPSLLAVVPLLIAGVTIPVLRSFEGARRARFPGEQLTTPEILVRRGICGLLCLLQPLARLQGRFLRGLVPWRNRSRSATFVWPRLRHLTFWRGVGDSPQVVLRVLEDRLAQRGSLVRRDSGWDDWDLEVEGGVGGQAQLRSCVEWHEGGQQLHRYAIVPKLTRPAMALPATGCFVAVWAAFGGNGAVALTFLGASALIGLRALWECGTASSALLSALESTFAAETFARDTAPEGRRTPVEAWHGASSPRTHESGGRSRLQAAG